MAISKQIRLQLGLTQNQLATLLGVGEGLLSMVDSGKRTLPTEAAIRLARFQFLMQQLPQPIPQMPADAPAKTQMEKQVRKMEKEVKSLTMKREKLEEKAEGLQKILHLADMPQVPELFGDDGLQTDQWNLIVRKAKQKLSKLLVEVLFLKIKIQGLMAGIEEARQHMG